MSSELYNQKFYDAQVDGSIRSAKVILGLLFDIYKPESVADFGCGRGGWLATTKALGSKTLHGFDGAWVKPAALIIPKRNIALNYDLCISVEVAKHISEARSQTFIDRLCKTLRCSAL